MANNFSLILTLATVITGIIWVIDLVKLKSSRVRVRNPQNIEKSPIARTRVKVIDRKIKPIYINNNINLTTLKPLVINTCSSMFPILGIVLIIRSFIYEPFQIPSGSMMPNLLIGDFILVKKYAYALKDPIMQITLLRTGKPKRGDIAVFQYPKDPKVYFVKRIIGLPGDKIVYNTQHKELQISQNYSCSKNKQACTCIQQKLPISYSGLKDSKWSLLFNTDAMIDSNRNLSHTHTNNNNLSVGAHLPKNTIHLHQAEKIEKIGDINHKILVLPQLYTPSYYQQPGFPDNEWVVPPKHYFMMGDNRDLSSDSRIWGFVPEANLIGKVILIWFSLDKNENEWPTGFRFNRIGSRFN